MKKKIAVTPKSVIKSALHRLWLRSRERASAVKREKNTCQKCHKKGSRRKGAEVLMNVHHKDGVDVWGDIIDLIRERLLCDPSLLEVLCVDCHKIEHTEDE